MQVQIREEVRDVFSSFGISDVESVLENEAIMILLTKESKYNAEYNLFKNKYNSEFEEFKGKSNLPGRKSLKLKMI